jgi:hypothetical protein
VTTQDAIHQVRGRGRSLADELGIEGDRPENFVPGFLSLREAHHHARALKERDGLPFTIAVDEASGAIHRVLDGKPNAA